MKLLLYCLLAMLWPVGYTYAQTSEVRIRPLTVGDTLPNFFLTNVHNSSASNISLSNYDDELLILSLVNLSCRSCINFLPRLDSVQREYPGRLKAVAITLEDNSKVEGFLLRQHKAPELSIPIASEKEIHTKLFPYEYVPHIIWVHKKRIIAITHSEYVNRENINAVLAGKNINWPIKREVVNFNYGQPLLHLNNAIIPDFSLPKKKFYSHFSSHMENIPRQIHYQVDSAKGIYRRYFINSSILQLYFNALNLPYTFPKNRIVIELDDKEAIYNTKSYLGEWKQKYTYCYEATFPISLSLLEMNEKIKSDLNFYLNLNVRKEMRQIPCLILKKGKRKNITVSATETSVTTLENLLFKLGYNATLLPIIDETGIADTRGTTIKIDLSLIDDLHYLKSELQKQGYSLTAQKKLVELLVISKKQ